ncbi:MAG: phosphoglycolate phosphatase [Hyphomicrobiaceae bacterium]
MKAVIFDLDGTLIDSAAAICDNANVLMAEFGWPLLDVREARQYIGHGAPWFLEKALQAREGAYDPDTFDARLARLNEIYAAAPASANPPYPGVEAVLKSLHARADITIGMCTNKPAAPTMVIVEAFDWSRYFGTVIAGDQLSERKPHPLPLLTAIEQLGAKSGVYVGDSEVDAETAAAANIPFVLYANGYRKTPVADIAADAVFTDHTDLPDIIDRL